MLRGRFDIRPKAQLAGSINFSLTPDKTNMQLGENLNILVSASLSDQSILLSGVDFSLFYDAARLELVSLSPVTGAFSDVVLLDDSGSVSTSEPGYSSLRLAMVAKKAKPDLKGGTVALANVTFKAKQSGAAKIKFPDDNSMLQVVGTGI